MKASAKFKFHQTGLQGLLVVEPTVFRDERGGFMESWNRREFAQAGLHLDFVQDNQSVSKRGVLRGLHFQKKTPQGKLVQVLLGEVFDVAVDLRPGSPTYGQWRGVVLSSQNNRQLLVPEGFAHGFLAISETAVFSYKCTQYYDPSDEGGILWCCPQLAIEWPLGNIEPILSEKDKRFPTLSQIGSSKE